MKYFHFFRVKMHLSRLSPLRLSRLGASSEEQEFSLRVCKRFRKRRKRFKRNMGMRRRVTFEFGALLGCAKSKFASQRNENERNDKKAFGKARQKAASVEDQKSECRML